MIGCFNRYLELKKLIYKYVCKSEDRLTAGESAHMYKLCKRENEDRARRQPFKIRAGNISQKLNFATIEIPLNQ